MPQIINNKERAFLMNKVISLKDGKTRRKILQVAVALADDAPNDTKADTFYAALGYYVDNPRKLATDHPRYVSGSRIDDPNENVQDK